MQYNYFIQTLKQHQTSHIKSLFFSKSCAPQKIPPIFLKFLPEILNILENHIQKLCKADQCLALFGFQPGSIPITSTLPLALNRVINKHNPTEHMCCSLAYLVIENKQTQKIKTWSGSKTIMVDFTKGFVMNEEYYTSLIFNESPSGMLYGTLDNAKLNAVWEKLNMPVLLVA